MKRFSAHWTSSSQVAIKIHIFCIIVRVGGWSAGHLHKRIVSTQIYYTICVFKMVLKGSVLGTGSIFIKKNCPVLVPMYKVSNITNTSVFYYINGGQPQGGRDHAHACTHGAPQKTRATVRGSYASRRPPA